MFFEYVVAIHRILLKLLHCCYRMFTTFYFINLSIKIQIH